MMNLSLKRTAWVSIAALVGLGLLTSGASAKETGHSEDAYIFELQLVGAKVGEGMLSIGEPREIGGKNLRPVRLEARTDGFGAKVYKAVTSATTWVDSRWLPVRARWDGEFPKSKRLVKAKWEKRILDGTYLRNGKLRRRIKTRMKRHSTDLVSVFAYLANKPLEEGKTYKKPLYDGNRIYDMTAVVGKAQEIHVPVGMRKAWPIKVTVKRKGFEKKMVYWVDEDRSPVKLSFDFGIIGSVDAVLTGKRKIRTIAKN